MIRYRQITKVQKEEICNGCGAKGGWIKPPNFIFKASCNQHDFYYWRGATEHERLIADESFYKFMKIDIDERQYSFLKTAWYHAWAYSYFKAVRIFGKKAFNFEREMTQADLDKLDPPKPVNFA